MVSLVHASSAMMISRAPPAPGAVRVRTNGLFTGVPKRTLKHSNLFSVNFRVAKHPYTQQIRCSDLSSESEPEVNKVSTARATLPSLRVLVASECDIILRGREVGCDTVEISVDLGVSTTTGRLEGAGLRLPDVEGVLAWSDIEMIKGDSNGCFGVRSDGTIERIQMFSESTGRAVSLLPSVESRAPPTALVAGFPMHSADSAAAAPSSNKAPSVNHRAILSRRGLLLATSTASLLALPPLLRAPPPALAATTTAQAIKDCETGKCLSERVGVWAELEDATNTSRMYTKYEGAFSLRFFEYLSRILLNHDNTSKQWWERKVRELPRKNDPVFTFAAFESQSKDERRAFREQVLRDAREQQYSEFVAAVELSVARRYSATSAGVVSLLQFLSSEPGWYQTPDGCKQLAICFSFVDNANQPTAAIDRLLAESEARSVTDITLTNPGSGYTGAVPTVTVAPPRAAMFKPDGRALSAVDAAKAAGAAKATATLRPSGRIARIVVKNGGKGYSSRSPPVVTIAPPLALSDSADIFGLEVGEDRNDRPDMFATATATAEVKGGIVVAILIQTKGAGYQFGGDTENASGPSVYNTAPPLVTIAPPSGSLLTADAEAVLDQEVASISVDLRGYGYSPEQLQRPGGLVSVQTPAECGGQATGVAASATASISPPVPLVKQPGGPEELRKFGSAYAQSVSAVLTSLLPTAATKLVRDGSGTIDGTSAGGLGSVAAAAAKGKELVMKTGGLPAEVDCSRCYGLWKVDGLPAAGELDKFGAQGLEFWPGGFPAERKRGEGVDVVFGRRAKVPVEKEEPLSLANFGKIALSGAICSSFGHTLLTPIELVKTRLQLAEEAAANKAPKTPAGATKGKKVEEVRLAKEVPSIPSIVSGIYRDEGGIAGLFAGWESATFGHFLSGAAGFGCTELFRRALLIEGGGFAALDSQGINRGIVILVASLSAGILSTVIIAPFEKARVRLQKSNEPEPATALDTLKGPFRFARGLFNSKKLTDGAKKPTETQPKTLAQALTILYKDERGPIPGFFDNVPLLLVRDTVYAMVKFLTFDKVRTAIFLALPIARESFASSLQVSLVSGSAAGMLAALVSQPGDTVFTKVSVEKEAAAGVKKRGPVEIVKDVLKDQGVAGLYVGSVERLLFAGILIAVEFAVYDYLRILLKVTNDDLVLVLDVLAG